MENDHKETIRVRAISVGFAVLALGVFKPFGLDAWGGETYVHLLLIWVLGFGACFLTEAILRYVAKMPRSYEQGVVHTYPMIVRSHSAFLVNLQQVEQIVSRSGSMQLVIRLSHDAIPVSRSNMAQIKGAIANPISQ